MEQQSNCLYVALLQRNQYNHRVIRKYYRKVQKIILKNKSINLPTIKQNIICHNNNLAELINLPKLNNEQQNKLRSCKQKQSPKIAKSTGEQVQFKKKKFILRQTNSYLMKEQDKIHNNESKVTVNFNNLTLCNPYRLKEIKLLGSNIILNHNHNFPILNKIQSKKHISIHREKKKNKFNESLDYLLKIKSIPANYKKQPQILINSLENPL